MAKSPYCANSASSGDLPGFSFQNARLNFQGKLVVGPVQELRTKFLQEFHNSALEDTQELKEHLKDFSSFSGGQH